MIEDDEPRIAWQLLNPADQNRPLESHKENGVLWLQGQRAIRVAHRIFQNNSAILRKNTSFRQFPSARRTGHRIRFTPAGVWRKDWQTTLELADDGTGTLVIAGFRSPCPWTVEKEHFVLHFTGWGTKTCDILDGDILVEMPEKSMKWSRIKSGQKK
jgi:hypothetical protein